MPTKPPLDYVTSARVGGVTISIAGGTATVFYRPSWRTVVVRLLPTFIVPMTGLAMIVAWKTTIKADIGGIVAGAVIFCVGAALPFQAVVPMLAGYRFDVDPSGIAFTGRAIGRVLHQKYPRSTIADVKVRSLRLKNQMFKRRYVTLMAQNGGMLAVLSGPRHELELVAEAFNDGLGLTQDAIGEAEYPPSRGRWSRVDRQVVPTGVIVVTRPRPFGVVPAVLAVIAFAVTAMADHFVTADMRYITPTASPWGLVRIVLIGSTLTALALAVRGKTLRTMQAAVADGRLVVVENSLLRPGRAEWPLERVASIDITDKGSRKVVTVTTTEGLTEPLTTPVRGDEAGYVRDCLALAMGRASRPPVAVGTLIDLAGSIASTVAPD